MKNGTCDRWRPIHFYAAAAGAAAFFLAGTGTARADYLEVCRDAQARGEVLDQSCTEALRQMQGWAARLAAAGRNCRRFHRRAGGDE